MAMPDAPLSSGIQNNQPVIGCERRDGRRIEQCPPSGMAERLAFDDATSKIMAPQRHQRGGEIDQDGMHLGRVDKLFEPESILAPSMGSIVVMPNFLPPI